LLKVEHFLIIARMNERFPAQITTASDAECSASGRQVGALLLLNSVFVVLVLLYAQATPPFEAPDAGAHYAYIVFLHQQRALPSLDESYAALSHQLVQQPPLYYALAAAATAWLPAEQGLDLLLPNPHYLRGLTVRATATVDDATQEAWLAVWIARGISMLGGLLALNATFLLVRVLFPATPWLALAAAGVVALNPRFLFSAATITNDAWAAGTATFAIWLMLRAARQPKSVRGWLWAGVALGLASLTKYSNLAIAAPAIFILVTMWRRTEWQRAIQATIGLAVGSVVVASFWYVRTWLLWGEVVPLHAMLAILPGLARSEPLELAGLASSMPVLRNSYWGEFGYGVLAQPWFFDVMRYAVLLAALGLVVCSVRVMIQYKNDQPAARQTIFALLLAAIWAGAVFVSLLNWMRLVNFTAQGRLLYSAITPISLLLVMGWQSLAPTRMQHYVQVAIPFVFALLASSQLGVLQEAYRLPPPLAEAVQPDRIVEATFANGIALIGADFPNGASIAGDESLPVTLYWRANTKIADFYTLFLHLTDSSGAPLYHFDGVPYRTQHPTPQWKIGEIFADSYVLHPSGAKSDDLATLTVGFYRHDQPDERVAVIDDSGRPIADVVTLAQVRVHVDKPTCPAGLTPAARWANGIQIADVAIADAGDASQRSVRILWTTDRTLHTSYTVFMQALDASDNIVAQVDRQPQQGASPTSTWRPGECIEDFYQLEDVPPTAHRLILGLYDAQLQRLQLAGGGDYVELPEQ
jgi:hypothetical protein